MPYNEIEITCTGNNNCQVHGTTFEYDNRSGGDNYIKFSFKNDGCTGVDHVEVVIINDRYSLFRNNRIVLRSGQVRTENLNKPPGGIPDNEVILGQDDYTVTCVSDTGRSSARCASCGHGEDPAKPPIIIADPIISMHSFVFAGNLKWENKTNGPVTWNVEPLASESDPIVNDGAIVNNGEGGDLDVLLPGGDYVVTKLVDGVEEEVYDVAIVEPIITKRLTTSQ